VRTEIECVVRPGFKLRGDCQIAGAQPDWLCYKWADSEISSYHTDVCEGSQDGRGWGVGQRWGERLAELLHFGREVRGAFGQSVAARDGPLLEPVGAVFADISIG